MSNYNSKVQENEKYNNILFQENSFNSCLPKALGFSKTRDMGSQNIDVESSLFGYKTNVSKSINSQSYKNIALLDQCSSFENKKERYVKDKLDNPKEKQTLSYTLDILPFEVQKNFRQFPHNNSRQKVKDMKEYIMKNN